MDYSPTTLRVRATVERLALTLSRDGRAGWVLHDGGVDREQRFPNLGQLAASILRAGGSSTQKLTEEDRLFLQDIATGLGVPVRRHQLRLVR